MDSEIWGPHAWFFLHTISFQYPDNPTQEQKIQHAYFFNSLSTVLPCGVCCQHFKTFIKQYPIKNSLGNKQQLIEWVLNCHNNVNKINNKPQWSLSKLENHYNDIYTNEFYHIINYRNSCVFLSILVVILLAYISCHKK